MIPERGWHQRLRIRVRELFRDTDPDTVDAYRSAITAVVTLSTSSEDLDEAERMGFEAILNDIEHGVSLIRMADDGRVELCRDGWCYRIAADPLEVVVMEPGR